MPTMLISHEVEDVDRLGSPQRAELFGKHDVSTVRTWHDGVRPETLPTLHEASAP